MHCADFVGVLASARDWRCCAEDPHCWRKGAGIEQVGTWWKRCAILQAPQRRLRSPAGSSLISTRFPQGLKQRTTTAAALSASTPIAVVPPSPTPLSDPTRAAAYLPGRPVVASRYRSFARADNKTAACRVFRTGMASTGGAAANSAGKEKARPSTPPAVEDGEGGEAGGAKRKDITPKKQENVQHVSKRGRQQRPRALGSEFVSS